MSHTTLKIPDYLMPVLLMSLKQARGLAMIGELATSMRLPIKKEIGEYESRAAAIELLIEHVEAGNGN